MLAKDNNIKAWIRSGTKYYINSKKRLGTFWLFRLVNVVPRLRAAYFLFVNGLCCFNGRCTINIGNQAFSDGLIIPWINKLQ